VNDLPPGDPEQAARIAGRYRVVGPLGRGGMGEVLSVWDETEGRALALKRMTDDGRGGRLRNLFEREYHTLASLDHPGIIRAYDYGVSDTGAYYTMELLDGEDLHQRTPMPWAQACPLLRDVAGALSLLHSRHLLHRDLNAKNVRVTSDGHAKLIDFGALTRFGVPRFVVGTPPVIPPEALGENALDQRADLYSFGALAYYALGGKHAYPARTIDRLPLEWAQPPTPLGQLADMPEELERLIMSLLSIDPQGRPHSAAEVIDRLGAAASLPTEEALGTARRNLPRPALIGREDPLSSLASACAAAVRGGGGSAFVVTGPAGIGKARLLSECAVEAQLLGLDVAQIRIVEHAPGLALLRSILGAVHMRAPELAAEMLSQHAPELRAYVPGEQSRRTETGAGVDALELRARLMAALRRWLQAFAEQRPLCLLLGSNHAPSEADAGLLALLAHLARDAPVVTVTALEDRREQDSEALSALRRFSTALPLGPLGVRGMEAMVHSVFGKVPQASVLSRWLHQVTGGNPAQSVEMMRHLVDARMIRYLGGTWVLPQSLDAQALPQSAEALVDAQLSQLGDEERALGEALSLCRGPLPLSLCRALGGSAKGALDALDGLSQAGVLVAAGDGYAFRSELSMTALRAGVEGGRRTTLHRRIARALLDDPTADPETRIEAAHHLVEAGDAVAGAELLIAGGVDFADSQGRLRASIGDLEAGLVAYRAEGRGADECIALLLPLMVAGMYSDRRLIAQYGEPTLSALIELTGLQRDPPKVVAKSPFVIQLLMCSTALVSAAQARDDVRAGADVLRRVAPLGSFPAGSSPRAIHEFNVALAQMISGRDSEARAGLLSMLSTLDERDALSGMPEHMRVALRGGLFNGLGMLLSSEGDARAAEYAGRLRELGHARYEVYAEQVLTLHHAYRGETEIAQAHQRRADLLGLQGAGSWRAEVWLPARLILAHQLCGDVVALKRTGDQLETLAKEIPTLDAVCDVARMAHHLERGEHAQALTLFEQRRDTYAEGTSPHWALAHGNCAVALNALGRHREAHAICTGALEVLDVPQGAVATRLWIERQCALAEHALDMPDEARDRLERLLHTQSMTHNPLMLGWLHLELGRLAIRRRDPMRYEHHRQQAQDHFGATGNADLMLRYERLVKDSAGMRRKTRRG